MRRLVSLLNRAGPKIIPPSALVGGRSIGFRQTYFEYFHVLDEIFLTEASYRHAEGGIIFGQRG